MLSAGVGRVFLEPLGEIRARMWAWDRYGPQLKSFWCLMFLLLVRFGFWVLFSP